MTQQLEFLRAVQSTELWQGIALATPEDLRIRMRGLVEFNDKGKRKIVYTHFVRRIVGMDL